MPQLLKYWCVGSLLWLSFAAQAQDSLRLELLSDLPARISINGSRLYDLQADSLYQFYHLAGQKFIRVMAADDKQKKLDTEIVLSQNQRYKILLKVNPPRLEEAQTEQDKTAGGLSKYLPKGIQINDLQASGFSALQLAVKAKDFAAVQALIGAGANINQASASEMHPSEELDVGKQTALLLAAEVGAEEILKYLLDKGASINQGDALGNTALHRAVEYNYPEIVKILLDYGADAKQKDDYFRLDPSRYAKKLRRKEILKIFKAQK